MATENNKNISYPNYTDLYKRQRICTDSTIKSSLLSKINTFITAVKVKHM